MQFSNMRVCYEYVSGKAAQRSGIVWPLRLPVCGFAFFRWSQKTTTLLSCAKRSKCSEAFALQWPLHACTRQRRQFILSFRAGAAFVQTRCQRMLVMTDVSDRVILRLMSHDHMFYWPFFAPRLSSCSRLVLVKACEVSNARLLFISSSS